MPAASGLTNFVRITAGAIGTSIATTLWENRAALHHAQLAEADQPAAAPAATRRAVRPAAAAGLTAEQALAQINRLVDQQAFMLAANDIFCVSALLFLVLIPLVWLTRPQKASARCAGRGGRRALGLQDLVIAGLTRNPWRRARGRVMRHGSRIDVRDDKFQTQSIFRLRRCFALGHALPAAAWRSPASAGASTAMSASAAYTA